jgi:hypothetical protein
VYNKRKLEGVSALSNIQTIRRAYIILGKELGKVVKKRLKDYFGINWIKEVSKTLNKEITENDYDRFGSKEILTIIKRKTEIFKNDIPSENMNKLKNLAYELLDFNNKLDHTNIDRVKTDDTLRIIDDFRRVFNFFKDEVKGNVFDEIEGKFDRILDKLYSQRIGKEESNLEIIDPHFKNNVENAQIDEYELEEGIKNNCPDVFTQDEMVNRKVKFEVNGFLISLVLRKRENVLEIVKGSIKKAYR